MKWHEGLHLCEVQHKYAQIKPAQTMDSRGQSATVYTAARRTRPWITATRNLVKDRMDGEDPD